MQGPRKGRLQHRQLGKWKWWQERHQQLNHVCARDKRCFGRL